MKNYFVLHLVVPKLQHFIFGVLLYYTLLGFASCTAPQRKRNYSPPTSALPLGEIIYGRPLEIREISIPNQSSKQDEDVMIFDWSSRKVTIPSYDGIKYIYLGTDLQPDSSSSEDGKQLVHYLSTPFLRNYISYSRTVDQQEYQFNYNIDTSKRQLRENHFDTSTYSIDYFNKDGFLIHHFVKLSNKVSYHFFYINDYYGNPIEERMILNDLNNRTQLDFIQEKLDYEYDVEGNWIVKNRFHFLPYDQTNSKHIQYRRKITYSN